MRRRDLLKTGHSCQVRTVFCVRKCGRMCLSFVEGLFFGTSQVANRLNQGLFGIDQEQD